MKPLLCFGEALIDFLNTGSVQVDGLDLPDFRQFPGGAPANVAVAFSKLGGQAWFAGQVGNDAFGRFLEESLVRYGVDTRFLCKHPSAHTALAFVTLDKDGDRSFEFYRDGTADILFSVDQISDDWFVERPMLHVCSNTLTNTEIAEVTRHALERANDAGSTISFDANLRPGLWAGGFVDRATCDAVARSAGVIKFAKEELDFLAGGANEQYAEELLAGVTRLIVVTDGGGPVQFFTRQGHGVVETPKVDVVDTTAAGDAFTAGLLRGLCDASGLENVANDVPSVEALLLFAIRCGSQAVTREGAFPSLPTFEEVAEYWSDMP